MSARLPLVLAGMTLAIGGLVAPPPAEATTRCVGHGGIRYAGTSGPTVHIICMDGLELWI